MKNEKQASRVDRRSFLKGASAVAAAGVAPWFVPASVFGKDAPSNRITIGLLGAGNQGALDAKSFLKLDGCQIVAVCDVNRASGGYRDESQFLGREPVKKMIEETYAERTGAGEYRGCKTYTDFRAVIAREDIDAVVVVVPDHWHAPMTVAAANAKKHVYCEKPLGLTIGDQRAMVKAVRENGVVLQTGSHARSVPEVRQACELVRNGYIGEVKRVTANIPLINKQSPGPGWSEMPVPDGFDYDMWLGPAPLAPYHAERCLYRFRFIYDYAGGQLTNFGAHTLDVAQWGLGMDGDGPVEVECVSAKFLPKGSLFDVSTHSVVKYTYANGAELICQTAEPSTRVAFEGTEGSVEIETHGKNFKTTPESLKTKVLRDDELLHKSDNHQQDFLDCIRSGKDPAAPVEVGHSSGAVCHLGNIAIRMNAKLKWDPKAEKFEGNDEANAYLHREARGAWGV